MWTYFFLKVLRLVVMVLLIAQVTCSNALAQETVPPEAAKHQAPESVTPREGKQPKPEEAKTEERQAAPHRNQEKTSTVSAPRLTFPKAPSPYDAEAIDKFNEQLYGAGN
jgi:hypothetical protein